MKVQVLGSGCPTCQKLYEAVELAVADIEEKVELEYFSGIEGTRRIIELGAMSSPLLVVDGKIALAGFTSDINKLKELILGSANKA